MLEKMKNLDRRWIFLFVLLAVVIPLLFPVNMPMEASKPVENIYDSVEKLPEGSTILMSFDYGPSTSIELGPAAEAVAYHAFKKGCKIVTVALWPDGAQISINVLNKVAARVEEETGRKIVYGKDYANLGYKAGGSVVLMGLKSGFAASFPKDVGGTPISQISLMNKVKDFKNIDMAFSFSGGVPGIKEYIMIVSTQFGVPLAGATTAVTAPELYTFLNSGQLVGLMGGLKGAAEYEQLIDTVGEARKGMVAQSIVHVLIVLFILFANVIYFAGEFRKKQNS